MAPIKGKRRWLTVIGLVILPVLAIGPFLWTGFNVEARAQNLQGAVVNLDVPITINGEYTPLGRELTNALISQNNANLNWNLVNEHTAAEGIASGKFSTAVTIPSNFSQAATSTSVPDATPEQATITVQTSPAIGIADSGFSKILIDSAISALNNTLTSAYLDQIYLGFNEIETQLTSIEESSRQLSDGAIKLRDGLDEQVVGINELAAGADSLATGMQMVSAKSATLRPDSKKLASGAKSLSDGLRSYVANVDKLVDYSISTTANEELIAVLQNIKAVSISANNSVQKFQQSLWNAGNDEKVIALAQAVNDSQLAELGCPAEIASIPTLGPVNACAIYSAGIHTGSTTGVISGVAVTGKIKALEMLPADQLEGIISERPDGTICIPTSISTASTTNPNTTSATGTSSTPASTAPTCVPADSLPIPDPDAQAILSNLEWLKGATATVQNEVALASQEARKNVASLKKLKQSGNDLLGGAKELSNGNAALASGMSALVLGLDETSSGANEMAAASSELAGTLIDTRDGGDELAQGAKEMTDGIEAGEMPNYSPTEQEKLKTVVSEPISRPISDAETSSSYGWATVLLVAALWLGSMAVWMLLPVLQPRVLQSAGSTLSLVISSLRVGLLVIMAQALGLALIAQASFQLPLGQFMNMLLLLLPAGVMFVVVNHALVAWGGDIGRFIAALVVAFLGTEGLTSAMPEAFRFTLSLTPLQPILEKLRSIVIDGTILAPSLLAAVCWLAIGTLFSIWAIARSRSTSVSQLFVPSDRTSLDAGFAFKQL
jgi:putative membrane protein